ncbi:hypothetical protein [Kineosporia sp. NBRC 101677]|uniref:hypothetical protein n=1 Tax=Kineosporia sp. NBRC 101677 TaxID=3032197 RepID=UPI002553D9E8|nr:hypothetical protein [Kineosporia sp. NBRC 101677]
MDKRWSPEQSAHKLRTKHGRRNAIETIYSSERHGSCFGPGDAHRPRFIVRYNEDRPIKAETRSITGRLERNLIVGSCNRSAIGTLVERTARFTILLPMDGTLLAETR